jgi:hypothetical protein
MGFSFHGVDFNVHHLFWDQDQRGEISKVEAERYHKLIDAGLQLGLDIYGSSTMWILPPYSKAKLTPPQIDPAENIQEALIPCVPKIGSEEYKRLSEERNAIWATLAHEFEEVRTWIVGIEPMYLLYNCQGQELGLEELIPFFADTSKGVKKAVKSENSKAVVIANFLGWNSTPIFIHGKLTQPNRILDEFLSEIAGRGDVSGDYFDQLATVLDPLLLLDRFPEGRPSSRGYSGTAFQIDTFEDDATHIPDSGYYPWWDEADSSSSLEDVPADDVGPGWAFLEIDTETGAGIKTVPDNNNDDDENWVPDEELQTGTSSDSKRWTAVADFRGTEEATEQSPHLGIFMRVQDFSNDQTRFGTIAYAIERSSPDSYCGTGDPCAALQFSDESDGKLFWFSLSEFPWDPPQNEEDHDYRVQIEERERHNGITGVYLQWWGGVYDLDDDDLIGSRGWIWEYSLWSYSITPPDLDESRILLGFAPGADGGAKVDLVATNYWLY